MGIKAEILDGWPWNLPKSCNVSLYGQITLIGSFTMYFPQEKSIFPVFTVFFHKNVYLKKMSDFFPAQLQEIESWNLAWMIPTICSLKLGIHLVISFFVFEQCGFLYRCYPKMPQKQGFQPYLGNSETKIHFM